MLWQDIAVGDILYITKNEMVPADIVVLDTFVYQEKENICYVDTYLVDGNKDMSIKYASSLTRVPPHLKQMKHKFTFYRKKLTGKLEYEVPNMDVNNFYGVLKLNRDPQTKQLNNDNFIPRGSRLKSDGW